MDLDLPNVPVSTSSHTYTWKLDTCASTHMTSEIELFEHLEPCDGTIRVGGDNLLLSEGIGTVLLNASLPDGSFHILRLKSVLYVPLLCHSLVSWTMLSEKGYVLTASGKCGFVSKDGCIVFMTELKRKKDYGTNGKFFSIHTYTYTYTYTYAAFNHKAIYLLASIIRTFEQCTAISISRWTVNTYCSC